MRILRCIAGCVNQPDAKGTAPSLQALEQTATDLSRQPGVQTAWIEDGTLYVDVDEDVLKKVDTVQ